MSSIKTLSIRQPWAWAVLTQGKDIENRTWPTNYRGKFYIHAGSTIDKEAVAAFKKFGFPIPDVLPTGGILGEVELVDCLQWNQTNSVWAEGPHCFVLANPKAYDEMIPCKGKLGFFDSGVDIPS